MKLVSSLKLVALSAVLAMTSVVAMASADPQELTIRDILTQQTQLRSQVVAGKGAFKDMSKREREELVTRQDRILSALGSNESFDQLPPDVRVTVFNDLEWVKAAVTKAEDDRKVCEQTRAVGSNRVSTVCMTAREQREHREGAQQSMRTVYKCDGCKGD